MTRRGLGKRTPGKGLGYLEEQLARERQGLPEKDPVKLSAKQLALLHARMRERTERSSYIARKMWQGKQHRAVVARRVAAGAVERWCIPCQVRYWAAPAVGCPLCGQK